VEELIFHHRPELEDASLVVGFSGWMDGGDVSTGTLRFLEKKLAAEKFAEIDPERFFIFNLPGTMEQVAQYRPHLRISNGLIEEISFPANRFFVSQKHNLVLFSGKEPNLLWHQFARCFFQVVETCSIRRIYFAGSVGGLTPHTREPRVFCSLSDEKYREKLEGLDVRFSDYEGPSSFINFLCREASRREMEMINFVIDIPTYVQATNPKGIAAVVKRLSRLLDVEISLEDLVLLGNEFEKNINELVAKMPDLAEQIKKLEENYDKEIWEDDQNFEEWLKRHGIDKL